MADEHDEDVVFLTFTSVPQALLSAKLVQVSAKLVRSLLLPPLLQFLHISPHPQVDGLKESLETCSWNICHFVPEKTSFSPPGNYQTRQLRLCKPTFGSSRFMLSRPSTTGLTYPSLRLSSDMGQMMLIMISSTAVQSDQVRFFGLPEKIYKFYYGEKMSQKFFIAHLKFGSKCLNHSHQNRGIDHQTSRIIY